LELVSIKSLTAAHQKQVNLTCHSLGFILNKFPAAKVLGVNVFIWGILLCCTAACQNSASLIAVRTLLGIFESVIAPALTLITSMWYKKAEGTPRYGIWYCGLGAGQMLGGIISFAFQHVSLTAPLHGWRIMFIVLGLVNICVAVAVLLFLPDHPKYAKWLSAAEKKLLHSRLLADQSGVGERIFDKKAIPEALKDSQIWLLMLATILFTIPSGVITTFSAILIKGYGYTSKQSALLNIPSGVVSIIATMASTYSVAKGFSRWISILCLVAPTIIGAGLMSFLDKKNQAGGLAGIYLINSVRPSNNRN
jgi:MFS family permease